MEIGLELEQAIERLVAHTQAIGQTEQVAIEDAVGRVIAQSIMAPFDNPPFDRSPLDGYTFKAESSIGASDEQPVVFQIIGEVCAGHVFDGAVAEGQAVRIMTGAKIPAGCDCVIRQEDVRADGEQLYVPKVMKHHQNYCFQGEDYKAGTALIQAGEVLDHGHIGVLASVGVGTIVVYRQPKVGVISTGDEIIPVGQPLEPGKIYNSNLPMLVARLKDLGARPIVLGQADDNAQGVADMIAAHIDEVDLLITTGGVSVGKMDIIHDVIKILPVKPLFWRVNMKPGTPILCYEYKDKLCIGLSGNPYAALATFELLVRPVLAKMAHNDMLNVKRLKAVLADDFLKNSPGRRFIRAYWDMVTGKVTLPGKNHSSGVLFSAVGCNAMIDIPKGTPQLTAGQIVDVVIL